MFRGMYRIGVYQQEFLLPERKIIGANRAIMEGNRWTSVI